MQRYLLKCWIIIICIASGCIRNDKNDKESVLYIQPYVCNVTATSAEVIWVEYSNTGPRKLKITTPVRKAEMSKISTLDKCKEIIHIVKLENLSPFTTYEYVINVPGNKIEGEFRTAPVNEPPIDFVIYGDTRTYPERHEEVSLKIAEDNPMFVLMTGDFVNDGNTWDLWKNEFFDPATPYLKKTVIFPVRGNHEGKGYYFQKLFNIPLSNEFYSFNYSNLHIMVLDQFVPQEKYKQMLAWVEEDLKANKKTWTIVTYHKPTFNISGHASKWGREDFLPLFEKYGVDFVICGHSHVYERFRPINISGGKPIIHIVSAGGGAPHPFPEKSPLLVKNTALAVLHHLNFRINGNKLEMIAKQSNGNIIDSLTLIKNNGNYQKEIMEQTLNREKINRIEELFNEFKADFSPCKIKKTDTVRIRISDVRFVNNTEIQVFNNEQNHHWMVLPQKIKIINKKLEFNVVSLSDQQMTIEGYQHPLSVKMSFTDRGIEYNNFMAYIDVLDQTAGKIIPEPAAVDIYYSNKISIDGNANDWNSIESIPLPYHQKKVSNYKIVWSDKGLFISALAIDSFISVNADLPFTGDAFEIFIDKGFNRPLLFNRNSYQIVVCPIYIGNSENNNKPLIKFLNKTIPPERISDQMKGTWMKTTNGFFMEFFIPKDIVTPTIAEGAKIGLNFCLINDGKPVEFFYCDKQENYNYQRPITWGAVKLVKKR